MVSRAAIFAIFLVGCLDEPVLTTCAEYPVDTNVEVCGSPCEIYCDELLATCGELVGSADPRATCLAACQEFRKPGDFNDERGDSVACRTRQAVLARDNPALCAAAMFDGGGVCVNDACDNYCDGMLEKCPDMFQDAAQCRAACLLYPTGGDTQSGNSLECRLNALAMDLCEEASMTSLTMCGTPCEGYCNQVVPTCGGRIPFNDGSLSSCLDVCSLMSSGSYTDWQTDTDSIQCRAWHAGGPAQIAPDDHCPHASLYNDQKCGDTCGTWCSICLDQFGGDFNACLPDCQARVAAGEPLFPDPTAPLQCR